MRNYFLNIYINAEACSFFSNIATNETDNSDLA